MAEHYAMTAKLWQIHDVLRTLYTALPDDRIDAAVPVQGVVSLLLDLSRDAANQISELNYTGADTRSDIDNDSPQEDA